MNQNIRLGTVDGVPVGANWTVLAIFVLIAWELADLVLPGYHPHDAVAVYWFAGIVAAVLFFASLLAHEVSHTVVATHNGIKVRAVTLWLFGGVSELESEALTPAADFRIAVVGPLTSLVLAGVFGVVGILLHGSGGTLGLVGSAVGWLAWVNLLLGLFNLVPAAPLDGGRVLRSWLWHRTGDRVRALDRRRGTRARCSGTCSSGSERSSSSRSACSGCGSYSSGSSCCRPPAPRRTTWSCAGPWPRCTCAT